MRADLEMYDITNYTMYSINVLHGKHHVQRNNIQGRYGDISH